MCSAVIEWSALHWELTSLKAQKHFKRYPPEGNKGHACRSLTGNHDEMFQEARLTDLLEHVQR